MSATPAAPLPLVGRGRGGGRSVFVFGAFASANDQHS